MEAPKAREILNENEDNLIIVTGFGPFVGHEDVNASWEAVRLLPDSIQLKDRQYQIKKIEVPVQYAEVDAAVEKIWSLNPMLVVHCGVHGQAKCVHIEKSAYNHQFRRPDYSGVYLKNHSAPLKCSESKTQQNDILACRLDLDKLSKIVQNSCECIPNTSEPAKAEGSKLDVCRVSYDVGDYLCGYIYLRSLDYDDLRTLFVHVPTIKEFPSDFTKNIIMKILEECLRQLTEDFCECKTDNM